MPYNRRIMTTLTITTKGQVTLKRDLLKHLGVEPGEKIEADKLPDGRIVVKAAAPNGTIGDFVGCLAQKRGSKLSIDEIDEIARRGWSKAK
jgi:bifunctional DNA-binding transcriptional regulator/antitoxin component of YhaV-PrlF toxin-antitoxin module